MTSTYSVFVAFLVTFTLLSAWSRSSIAQRLNSRSDDVSAVATAQERQAQEIQELQAKLVTMETEMNTQIAALQSQMAKVTLPLVFTAENGAGGSKNYQNGDVIHWTRVIADEGGMYDNVTGLVRIPQDGLYTVYLRTDVSATGAGDNVGLDLQVNDVRKITSFGEHGVISGVGIALRLQSGDRVWVVMRGSHVLEPASVFSLVRVSL